LVPAVQERAKLWGMSQLCWWIEGAGGVVLGACFGAAGCPAKSVCVH